MAHPEPSNLTFVTAAVALAVALPLLAVLIGSSPRMLLLGALAWLAAVALKLLVAGVLRFFGGRPLTTGGRLRLATLQGAFSATTELGTAVLFFQYRELGAAGVADMLAFGLGAWAFEVLLVVLASLAARLHDPAGLEARQARWVVGARRSLWVRGATLWERLAALVNHVGARGVVLTAATCGTWVTAALAWLGFAAVDGVAAHGNLAPWDWFDPGLLRRYYGFVFALGAVQVVLFAALTLAC